MSLSLRNYWHPIARSDQVGEQPSAFRLLAEDLVAFRTVAGVHVFRDVCIHRGTALSLGWVKDGVITCAYHGFQYDTAGRCVRIPSRPEGTPIPSKARAVAYRAQEAHGVVWVALDEPIASMPVFPNAFDHSQYRAILAYQGVWETSAGRVLENFFDFSHFAWVHEGVLGSRDDAVAPEHDVEPTETGFTFSVSPPSPAKFHSYEVLLPFVAHMRSGPLDGEHLYISRCVSPLDPKRTFVFDWLVRNHALDPADDQRFIDFQEGIAQQDKPIAESQKPEQIPVDLRDEFHIRVPDAASMQYRRQLAKIDQEYIYHDAEPSPV